MNGVAPKHSGQRIKMRNTLYCAVLFLIGLAASCTHDNSDQTESGSVPTECEYYNIVVQNKRKFISGSNKNSNIKELNSEVGEQCTTFEESSIKVNESCKNNLLDKFGEKYNCK